MCTSDQRMQLLFFMVFIMASENISTYDSFPSEIFLQDHRYINIQKDIWTKYLELKEHKEIYFLKYLEYI